MTRLLLIILMGLLTADFPKTDTSDMDSEVDAIRAVANAYISADPVRLRDSFLPSMNLYTTDEKGGLRTIPFAEYLERVLANANAAPEERQASIDLIDRVGNVAVVKVTTIRPQVKVTDYLSLVRIENRWKVVNKAFFVESRNNASSLPPQTSRVAQGRPCAEPDHHRFDFMIGEWRTTDPGNVTVSAAEGESTVEPILDGCILHEHRSLARQGKRLFDGDAYWGYDSATKHWLLFYMDDLSHMQVYEGREEAGHLAFYRERPDPDGKVILIRIIYTSTSALGYTQTVERSTNHGETWEPGGVTGYKSKR
jgi:hypothetical protein